MTHKHGRTDANQADVVQCLRDLGASVQSLADIGQGCPDLLVGWRELNFVLEVKDGAQPPSKRKLTPAEYDWHDAWRGQKRIVYSGIEAVEYVVETARHILDNDGLPF
jgi:hypothetical protein